MRSFLALLWLAAQAGTPDAGVPTPQPRPPCLSATQLEARARETLREPGPLSASPYTGPLSPPLPVAWPPAGEPAVRLYAFHSMALPTGVVAFRYSSPHAVAEVPLRGEAPKLKRLKSRVLGREDDRPVKASSVSQERATEALLQALCRTELPSGPDAEALRAGYLAWADSQPLMAKELRTHAPAFFTWLGSNKPGER
ncbi:hypothetical protein [Hyalangium sp.]|uniref:hypothetical protein n=1 Tax=Hyalangium sp. TaxID=2028555 RepID=UPI002D4DB7F7|nr:hypothetical protein [Hyalangium sp.]HYH98225.1 hypothetical protein [Hyalangium sp.]